MPVEGAVAGVLVLVVVLAVLLAVGALHSGTQIPAVSVVVVETVSEVKCRIISIISEFSVRVEVLEQLGQLIHVVVPQVRVVEGGAERAHVGGPGRHLAAVRSNAEHVDLGRGGDTWAGRVARCREAWRGARWLRRGPARARWRCARGLGSWD